MDRQYKAKREYDVRVPHDLVLLESYLEENQETYDELAFEHLPDVQEFEEALAQAIATWLVYEADVGDDADLVTQHAINVFRTH